MKEKNEIVKKEETSVEIGNMQATNLSEIENVINAAVAAPVELLGEYWNPKRRNAIGETKRLCFQGIKVIASMQLDETEEEVNIDLKTAFFVEVKEGVAKTLRQSSWRLITALENIEPNTWLEISYKGETPNQKNQFMSSDWSVKRLNIN